VRTSLEAAGAAALGHDVRYIKCPCTGVFKRFSWAIGANFVTLNREGRWTPSYAKLGAAVGTQYIGDTWMPPGYRNWNTLLRDAGMQITYSSIFNVIKEFYPSKKP
jgi:hypothetical protein